jgi:ABC-type multidrug transport system permease subunit
MYYLTPFRYLLEGFLSVVIHNVPIRCDANEFARFRPPPNQSCQEYVAGYIRQVGGYVEERNGECAFCQYANGDQFGASLNVLYSRKWLNYGVFFAFCIFNFAVVYFCTWLYLGGWQRLMKVVNPKQRRQRKALEKARSDREHAA